MNILFLEYGINPYNGGVQRVTHNVAIKLKAAGYKVFVAYYTNEHFDKSLYTAFDSYIQLNRKQPLLREILQFIRENHISIIINQCGASNDITKFLSLVKIETGVKIFSFIHISPTGSIDVLKYRNYHFPKLVIRSLMKEIMFKFFRPYENNYRFLYDVSDKIVLLSEKFKSDFCKIIKSEDINNKIVAIPNSVTYNVDSQQTLSNKENVILVVARMGETPKRLSRVLECWKRINTLITNWDLCFIGDGPELRLYKSYVKKYKLPRVSFIGKADPKEYYQKASIFLMTSATEGFGMTILEAQQFGVVPIAMNSYKSVTDLITNGYNGFIVNNDDITDLSDKVIMVANDSILRNKIGNNAIISTKRFYFSEIYKKWEKLLSND